MGASAEFVAFVCELLEPLGGGLSSGPFFGGRELRYHGRQFAWILNSTLYLRVNDATRPDFEAQGARPFSYVTKRGEVVVRKFYTAPEMLFDDSGQMVAWSRRAIEAAAP